ncbi:hypothetical protein ccbrp13_54840 [Ktedonobacteria bacterium brp13]|nr:hypothetical protein ccbrp13_54840 [Ktedonobacteria bacterium brp13]
MWEEQIWRRDLLVWQVSTPESDSFPQLIQDIAQYWKPASVTLVFSIGIALLLFSVSWNVLSLLVTGTFTGLLEQNGNLITLGFVLFVILGYGCGTILGMWRVRRHGHDRMAFGDLRQRRLTDYRSIIFPCILIVLIAFIVILTLFTALYGGSTLHIQFVSGKSIDQPKSPWLLGAVPAFMLLSVGILEVCMTRVVVFSRIPIMVNPVIARRADDMLRAIEIGMLTGIEFFTLGTLMQVQFRLLVPLSSTSHTAILEIALTLTFLLGGLLVFFGISITGFFRGRLGGKVSGWIGR